MAEYLESVFQSLEGDEIILIDNGTSDSYWEICINYSDTHPVERRVRKSLNNVFLFRKISSQDGASNL